MSETVREWLGACEARAEAATGSGASERWMRDGWEVTVCFPSTSFPSMTIDCPNDDIADFIAHARTDVPALVAALSRVLNLCDWAEHARQHARGVASTGLA